MAKIPEGRKPIPDDWFVDRANKVIRDMTPEERQRAKDREKRNKQDDDWENWTDGDLT